MKDETLARSGRTKSLQAGHGAASEGIAIAHTDCVIETYAYLDGMTVHFPFQNTYATLPDGFFARVAPTPVA